MCVWVFLRVWVCGAYVKHTNTLNTAYTLAYNNKQLLPTQRLNFDELLECLSLNENGNKDKKFLSKSKRTFCSMTLFYTAAFLVLCNRMQEIIPEVKCSHMYVSASEFIWLLPCLWNNLCHLNEIYRIAENLSCPILARKGTRVKRLIWYLFTEKGLDGKEACIKPFFK